MTVILRRVGLPLSALIGTTFWLLPIIDAFVFLAVLSVAPAAVVAASRMPTRLKATVSRYLTARYVVPVLIVIGITLPFHAGAFELRFYSEMLILGLLAMSLDIMMGYIGLASFAHAALAGVAAYTIAITLIHLAWPPWAAIAAALFTGTAATTAMGAFSVRVRDIYFGIITLVFGSVAFVIANTWVSVTNGEDGMTIDLPVLGVLGLFEIDTSEFADFWYFTFTVVLASYLFLRLLMRSPMGLVFHGIRENEQRVRYLGYNVNAYKILNTGISGFFASTAGILLLFKNGIVGTEQMFVIHSGEVVIWAVIGGLGTLIGPFLGASFVHYITDYLGEFTERYILLIGLVFIVTILLAPRGIVGAIREAWRGAPQEEEEEP